MTKCQLTFGQRLILTDSLSCRQTDSKCSETVMDTMTGNKGFDISCGTASQMY